MSIFKAFRKPRLVTRRTQVLVLATAFVAMMPTNASAGARSMQIIDRAPLHLTEGKDTTVRLRLPHPSDVGRCLLILQQTGHVEFFEVEDVLKHTSRLTSAGRIYSIVMPTGVFRSGARLTAYAVVYSKDGSRAAMPIPGGSGKASLLGKMPSQETILVFKDESVRSGRPRI